MKDRLDAMHLFVRVAEMGSFAAVAQQRNVARSVVTRQIAALEALLGTKLIARSTRRLSLTSAGAAYLEKCREILGLVAAIVAILAIACFVAWRQDADLREAGREYIIASGLPEDDLQIALLIADGCHGAALHEAMPEDIRGRKKLLSAQKGEYIRVLDRMVADRMKWMREKSPRKQADLLGYWERITNSVRTVVHLAPDGKYEQAFFAPDDHGHRSAVEKQAGTWSLSGGSIEWVYQGRPDPNPFVRFGDRAFAVREMDGSISYWERLGEHESVTRHFR